MGAAAATAAGSGKPVRVVLDTNIVLDWLVFADPSATTVGTAISPAALTWLTTPRMHAELRAVLSRPLATRWDPARELALTIDLCALGPHLRRTHAGRGDALTCRDASDQSLHRPALASMVRRSC